MPIYINHTDNPAIRVTSNNGHTVVYHGQELNPHRENLGKVSQLLGVLQNMSNTNNNPFTLEYRTHPSPITTDKILFNNENINQNIIGNMEKIKIKNYCQVTGSINNNLGPISIENQCKIIGSINNNAGSIKISDSEVKGNISTNYGNLTLENTKVQGFLYTASTKNTINSSSIKDIFTPNDKIDLGHNNQINRLEFNKSHPLVIAGQTTLSHSGAGGSISVIGGSLIINGRAANSPAMNGESPIQQVKLGHDTTLNELSFSADKCILTLSGNATFNGDHSAAGLEIKRI